MDEVEQICREYGATILRRCAAILGDRDAAQDVAQEVMVTLLRKADQLRQTESTAGWVYRVTTHACLNYLRASRRRRNREQSEAVALWADVAPADPYVHAHARDALRRLASELDPLSQQLLFYRYLDGMTQEEMASVTGKSRRTVGKRLKKIDALVAKRTFEQ